MAKVGKRLRELRIRRRLGMRELAARSGVSHSTLSLIERDMISPSIDTFSAVLDALGYTLPMFFSELASAAPSAPFYAATDLVEIGNSETISCRAVGLGHPNRQLLLLHEFFAAGARTNDNLTHSGQEGGIVISGSIELTVGNETRLLNQGDAYYFDSTKPHHFRNTGRHESQVFSVCTPPTY